MGGYFDKKIEPLYPNDLPEMPRSKVIEELEYDILIHEYWAVKVTQDPKWAPSMGDYDWHIRWIKVYEAAIYYLKGG